MKQLFTLWISVCLLVTAYSGCGPLDSKTPSESTPPESASTPESATSSNVEIGSFGNSVDSESPDRADTEPAEGTYRFNITLDYLCEDIHKTEEFISKSALFSFDIPDEWSIEGSQYQIILWKAGETIGQIELQPRTADITALFSDIDALNADTYATKDLTISGYPAKLYVLKNGQEGTTEIKPSYAFYIASDEISDAYVLIFFLPDVGTEDELETVASSLLVYHEWDNSELR